MLLQLWDSRLLVYSVYSPETVQPESGPTSPYCLHAYNASRSQHTARYRPRLMSSKKSRPWIESNTHKHELEIKVIGIPET